MPGRLSPRSHLRGRLGESGENLAAAYLQAHGYRIVARNWRLASGELRGEVDIVASRGRTLVFVEVKTRRGEAYGGPLLAVGGSKQAKVRALAAAFLRSAARGAVPAGSPVIRFDVIAVWLRRGVPPRIEHLPGVF
ncbi:MAG: YraN family protein [Nitriliruptorales bacterium]